MSDSLVPARLPASETPTSHLCPTCGAQLVYDPTLRPCPDNLVGCLVAHQGPIYCPRCASVPARADDVLNRAVQFLESTAMPRAEIAEFRSTRAALRAEVERLRKQHVELRHAGAALANCAYNLCQRPHLTDDERRSLEESQVVWDRTIAAQHRHDLAWRAVRKLDAALSAPPAEGPG